MNDDTTDKGFVTKGSEEYFAERETKIQARIDEAKSAIETIETRVSTEIDVIVTRRDRIRHHLKGFLRARNEFVEQRARTAKLIEDLTSVVRVCETELPALDNLLDRSESEYAVEDAQLDEKEQGRRRQLKKHERAKTRYELRYARVQLRKQAVLGQSSEEGAT